MPGNKKHKNSNNNNEKEEFQEFSDEEFKILINDIQDENNGITVKDRKWLFRTYPNCFVGSELVDWLIQKNYVENRSDGVAIGKILVRKKILNHVTKDHDFKDDYLFYRFMKDEPIKKSKNPELEDFSWSNYLPFVQNDNDIDQSQNLLPQIPHGFVDEDMEKLGDELDELSIYPLDEYNTTLLDNVHPALHEAHEANSVYNMVVIGAGAGGLVTSAGSAGVGGKVALIERHLLGGDCLNFGCVPSKALLSCAHTIRTIKRSNEFCVKVNGEIEVDFPGIMERMRKLRAQISPNDSVKRFEEELGVHVHIGSAKFVSKDSVEVTKTLGNKTTKTILKFHKCCIAVGARPAIPSSIPGLSDVKPLTNYSIFNLEELPESLAIIGSGAIGVEMASAFALFGTEVHLFSRSERILIREEKKAALIIQESLIKDGVHIHNNTTYKSVSKDEDTGIITLNVEDGDGNNESMEFSHILVSAGRTPNVTNLGLEEAGVNYDIRKGITVNDNLQTSNSRIFAVGDCCTKYKFTHVADHMARIVIRNALFFGSAKFSSLVIPWCTYTKPELAHVGLYESDLIESNIKYQTFEKEFSDLDRAILDGSTEGYIRVFVKQGTDKILGCTIVADNAGDIISEVTVAMTNKLGLTAFTTTIHPYPTQADIVAHVGNLYNKTRLTPTVKILFRNLLNVRRTTNI